MSRTKQEFLAAARRQLPESEVEDVVPCSAGLHPLFILFLPLELLTKEFVLILTPGDYILAARGRSSLGFKAVEKLGIVDISYRPGYLYGRMRIASRKFWVHRRFQGSILALSSEKRAQ